MKNYIAEQPGPNVYFIRVVKDIKKSDIDCSGTLPDLIPKGTITWVRQPFNKYSGCTHPEDNYFCANIATEYFEAYIPEPEQKNWYCCEVYKRRVCIFIRFLDKSTNCYYGDYVEDEKIRAGGCWAKSDIKLLRNTTKEENERISTYES